MGSTDKACSREEEPKRPRSGLPKQTWPLVLLCLGQHPAAKNMLGRKINP